LDNGIAKVDGITFDINANANNLCVSEILLYMIILTMQTNVNNLCVSEILLYMINLTIFITESTFLPFHLSKYI
jgi:hypothetical protein